jgi:hypothetical protein
MSIFGCARDGAPSRRPESRHDIDNAIGQTRFADQLTEPDRRQGRLLSRLQNQRIAKSQRRRDLPTERR